MNINYNEVSEEIKKIIDNTINEESKASYYTIIKAKERYDKRLTDFEKILLSEIRTLSNRYNYCFATNKYLAYLYDKSESSITKALSKLKDLNYIDISFIYKDKQVLKRLIRLKDEESIDKSEYKFTDNEIKQEEDYTNYKIVTLTGNQKLRDIKLENADTDFTTGIVKYSTPLSENIPTPIGKYYEDNNTSINNTREGESSKHSYLVDSPKPDFSTTPPPLDSETKNEISDFRNLILKCYERLAGRTATELRQIALLKTPKSRLELKRAFINRKAKNYKKAIACAEQDAMKSGVAFRFKDFINILYINLSKSNATLNSYKQIESLEKAETERQNAKIESAKSQNITLEEYEKATDEHADNIILNLKKNIYGKTDEELEIEKQDKEMREEQERQERLKVYEELKAKQNAKFDYKQIVKDLSAMFSY